ncbi:MAG TPA: hypothetical protein DCM10_20275, partial [Xanthomarina gelatinilytica]|nr:hypothetical protein [Xanthomarina gelatinilytica]
YGQKTDTAFDSIKSFLPSAATLEARAESYYDELADGTGPEETALKSTGMNVTFNGGKAGMEI